jgi:hypothetical protein
MEPSLLATYILIDVEHRSAVPIMIQILCSAKFQHVGQVGNLRADCQSAQTGRVNNPLQDGILPHFCG